MLTETGFYGENQTLAGLVMGFDERYTVMIMSESAPNYQRNDIQICSFVCI